MYCTICEWAYFTEGDYKETGLNETENRSQRMAKILWKEKERPDGLLDQITGSQAVFLRGALRKLQVMLHYYQISCLHAPF